MKNIISEEAEILLKERLGLDTEINFSQVGDDVTENEYFMAVTDYVILLSIRDALESKKESGVDIAKDIDKVDDEIERVVQTICEYNFKYGI